MEISLIRHGKSMCTDSKRIQSKEFKKWVEKYDDGGVFEESSYPSGTINIMDSAKVIITSDLKRSVMSAQLLNPKLQAISLPLFRETELPTPFAPLRDLKLNPRLWAGILRCIWFSGYSRDCESLSNAKNRAKKASTMLVEYAQEHSSVVLVGHGFFNLLIAKELRKLGWKGKKKTSSKHWSCTTYSFYS